MYYHAHLKNTGHSNYSQEEVVFSHSTEDIDFIGLPSIELIEYLYFQWQRIKAFNDN